VPLGEARLGRIGLDECAKNSTKSKVRARIEHAIRVIKRVFGFAKVRYRGLSKNLHRLLVACALANLFMARRQLLRCQPAQCVRNQTGKPCRHRYAASTRPNRPVSPPMSESPCPNPNLNPLIETFLNGSGGYGPRRLRGCSVHVV
jgi:hypothetical protein